MSLPPFAHDTQSKFTEPPNPTWSYCQPVDSTPAGRAWLEGEKQGWKVIDTADPAERSRLYPLLVSGVVPRPIAFVSTVSENGVENLAPFSWFNSVTALPPIVSFCVNLGPTRFKDTVNNVKNGNGFTVNIISEPFIANANVTAIDSPPEFEEWTITGLTKAPSLHVKAPRVKESAFSMECELFQAIDIIDPATGQQTCTLVLGHVKYIHVRNDVLTERGTVDAMKFKPVSRLGDISYGRVGDVFRLPRPVWATEEAKVKEAVQNAGRL